MPLVPILFCDWFDDEDWPLRRCQTWEQDLDQEFYTEKEVVAPARQIRRVGRKRSWCRSNCNCGSDQVVTQQQQKSPGDFRVNVDVSQFVPEQITVKATDRTITVEGKHVENDDEDEHNYAMRYFVRKYRLPEGYDRDKIVSTLSADGTLAIRAPKMAQLELVNERIVPVDRGEIWEKPDQNNNISSTTLEDVEE